MGHTGQKRGFCLAGRDRALRLDQQLFPFIPLLLCPPQDKRDRDNEHAHHEQEQRDIQQKHIREFPADGCGRASDDQIPAKGLHIFCDGKFIVRQSLVGVVLCFFRAQGIFQPCALNVDVIGIHLNQAVFIDKIDFYVVLFLRRTKQLLQVDHLNADTAYAEQLPVFVFDPGVDEYRPLSLIHLIAVHIQVIRLVFADEKGIPDVVCVIDRIHDLVQTLIGVIPSACFGHQKGGIIIQPCFYTVQVCLHGADRSFFPHVFFVFQKIHKEIIAGHCPCYNNRFVKAA